VLCFHTYRFKNEEPATYTESTKGNPWLLGTHRLPYVVRVGKILSFRSVPLCIPVPLCRVAALYYQKNKHPCLQNFRKNAFFCPTFADVKNYRALATKSIEPGKERRWLVGYCAPRSEKKVYDKLLKQGYDTYLPLAKSSRKWSDRVKIVDIPLFTSYIFVYLNNYEVYEALKSTPQLVRFIYSQGKFAEISEKEIENIKKFLSKTEGYQFSFEENQVVEVREGILKGRKGIITKLSKTKMQLRIEEFGWVVTAEILRTQAKSVE
jgi:transcription antitermination factor NusG